MTNIVDEELFDALHHVNTARGLTRGCPKRLTSRIVPYINNAMRCLTAAKDMAIVISQNAHQKEYQSEHGKLYSFWLGNSA